MGSTAYPPVMFGFLLFTAVVLSAVDVGSPMKISATVELNVSSVPAEACYKDKLQMLQSFEDKDPSRLACMPDVHTFLSVTNNNRVLASNVDDLGPDARFASVTIWNFTFPDILAKDIRLPMLLRVATSLKITCRAHIPKCTNLSSTGYTLGLIKMPKFTASRNSRLKAQLTFGDINIDHFHWSATLTVNYDTSDVTKGSECEDHPDDDLCPTNLAFSCPIFRDSMTNPCCDANIDASCMLRNQSNIKTTTTTTTPTTTIPSTTTTILTTTTTTPTTTSTTTTPTTTSTTPTTTSTTTTPTTTSTTTTPTTTSTTTTPTTTSTTPTTTSTTTTPTTTSTTTTPTTTSTTTTPTTTSTTPTTTSTTTTPTTTSTTTTPTTTSTTTSPTTTTNVQTSSAPPTAISTATTVILTTSTPITTPTAIITSTSIRTSPITATDTTATTTSLENPQSTLITTAKKLCTPATATTETVAPTTTCREDVYFWVMIEFILISAILLIGFIVMVVLKRREKKFAEEKESDEGNPQ